MAPFRKLPPRYNALVTPLLLSILMCCVVSGISTLRAVGLAPDIAAQWLRGWGLSWIVAFPTLLVVLPTVRRIAGLLVEQPTR